jgi:predicted glycosyl hydrolase (DUF1957 family)
VKVGIILHFYQPPTQKESVFREVTQSCYIPLLRLIEKRKEHHFTLDIPLSIIEQFDLYGYQDLIDKIKKLYAEERVTLLGSAAYHPLLTKIPRNLVEEQIILNEYGLGYYMGSRKDFEGDPSIMIKDLKGFFAPELALNEEVIKVLIDLGYIWAVSDNEDPAGSRIMQFKNEDFYIVRRDKFLSNMLAFKRDVDVINIKEYFAENKNGVSVLALDAETFGHHYNEGILLLEKVLDLLREVSRPFLSIDQILDYVVTEKIDTFYETTWSYKEGDNIYPLWTKDESGLQKVLWDFEKDLCESVDIDMAGIADDEDLFTLPFWKSESLAQISDPKVGDKVCTFILLHKFLHSDKYWWLSNKMVFDNLLHDHEMTKKSLKYAEALIENIEDVKNKQNLEQKLNNLYEMLK